MAAAPVRVDRSSSQVVAADVEVQRVDRGDRARDVHRAGRALEVGVAASGPQRAVHAGRAAGDRRPIGRGGVIPEHGRRAVGVEVQRSGLGGRETAQQRGGQGREEHSSGVRWLVAASLPGLMQSGDKSPHSKKLSRAEAVDNMARLLRKRNGEKAYTPSLFLNANLLMRRNGGLKGRHAHSIPRSLYPSRIRRICRFGVLREMELAKRIPRRRDQAPTNRQS